MHVMLNVIKYIFVCKQNYFKVIHIYKICYKKTTANVMEYIYTPLQI